MSQPVFLAFGPLVLTDIPIAFFSVLSIWAFANLWRSPQETRNIRIFALALSGAFLVKFSAPILLLGLLASALSTHWMPVPTQREIPRRLRWKAFGKAVLLTTLIVYSFYFILS